MTTYHNTIPQASQLQALSIDELNAIFTPLTFQERIEKLYEYFAEEDVLMTSSFGTKSVFLLHWFSSIRPTQVVHFLDTTYHFKETIAYKKQLTERFDLDVIDIFPDIEQNMLTREEQWWVEHRRMCCSINKVAPLEPIKAQHKIWVSGLMSYQTEFRSNLNVFQQQGDIIKFHPIVDIDEGEFIYYMDLFNLPRHPLEQEGFGSIGCTHCTAKGSGRDGRWKGSNQKECGLHPSYFIKKEGK